MHTFEEKLKEILALYEKTGNLEDTIKSLKLSSEQEKKLRASFDYLEKIEESARSLKEVRDRGRSTETWQMERIENMTRDTGYTENQVDQLIENLNDGTKKVFIERFKEEK